MAPVSEPVALAADEIKETLEDYRRAAANAKERYSGQNRDSQCKQQRRK
jgi:2,4-dienoyl-CoA reductase-like NADH-dependent reductase (Old Yellow Enzyme family)